VSVEEYKLTPRQHAFFDTFGYLAFPGLLADRIDEIISAFEDLWAQHGGGHQGQQHDHERRSCIVQFIDSSEILCTLLDDPRILGICTSLMGADFNYNGSDGNLYAGDTGWHSDGRHEDMLHIKLAFYLDPITRDAGCLRVIPGSHRLGDDYERAINEQVTKSAATWGLDGCDVPAMALETQPGDLVCFNHNTKHAAFGGSGRRRMFTMNCCQRYPEDRLVDLRKNLSASARFWVERAYGEPIVRTASPERMTHLEQCLANDGHLAELSRKARQEMPEPSRG